MTVEKLFKIGDWLLWAAIVWALFHWLPWMAALIIGLVLLIVVVILSLDLLLLFVRLLGRAWRGEV